MTTERQNTLIKALNRGFSPEENDLGFKYLDQFYVYDSEEETLRQYEMASLDVYVVLVRFTDGKWENAE